MMLTFFPLSYYKTAKFVEHMDRLNKGLNMIGGVAYVAEGAHSEAGEKAYVLGQTEFSLKNERMIRLFLGQEIFWSELKTVYENLKEYLTEKKSAFVDTLHFYIYGDNGLLIAAEESLTDDRKSWSPNCHR